jgi:hypothetical protein
MGNLALKAQNDVVPFLGYKIADFLSEIGIS